MKNLMFALLGAVLVGLAALVSAQASCDTDPGNAPYFFE